jgi:hypothetical protein
MMMMHFIFFLFEKNEKKPSLRSVPVPLSRWRTFNTQWLANDPTVESFFRI